MKNVVLGITLASLLFATACGDGRIAEIIDPSVQAAEDSATIINYLADRGFTGDVVSTTDTGVRYVTLKDGTGTTIDESDIVAMEYVGMLTNDTIFDTNSKKVADSIRVAVQADTVGKADDAVTEQLIFLSLFSEDRPYTAQEFTYSQSGWTLPKSPPAQNGFIPGYVDGISASLNNIKVGGTTLIVIPSSQAYGTIGTGAFIAPNTVIAFELTPTKVKKQ